jgi:glucuronoarabinoxylan endo-1,4-beta-xylanase
MTPLRARFSLFAATAILGLLGFASVAPAQADSAITVNSNLLKQKIVGFGASDAWQAGAIEAFPAAKRTKMLNLLFSTTAGAGLSMLRHRVPTGIEPSPGTWDWTTDDATVWLDKQARDRGVETVFSTPWSPPAWMKSNDDVNNGGSLEPAYYQAYATYLATYIQQYKAQFGVTIDAISLQNEPTENVPYESCLWSGQQFHDFLAGYLIPTFKADSIKTEVMMPENAWWDDSLASQTLADPATAAGVSIIASHDYGDSDDGESISPFDDAIAAGKQTWETEVSNLGTNDPSILDALGWAETIHNTIVVAEANAWNYWWLYNTNDTGGGDLIYGNSTLTDFTVPKRLWTIGNFARFVRPGFNLIGLLSYNPEAGVYTSAFRQTSSGKLVIVAINTNTSAAALTVNLPAFAVAAMTPYETSSSLNLAELTSIPVANGSFTCTLDPQSVTTFVGKGTVSNPSVPIQIACASNGIAPFLPDFDYNTGYTYSVSAAIDTSGVTDPAPAAVYQNQRWYPGTFQYAIPGLTAGKKYTVQLHFAETYFTGPAERLFNVAINGTPVLSNFDVFAAAGAADKAVVETFQARATSKGQIAVTLSQGLANNPMISGIEVLPA